MYLKSPVIDLKVKNAIIQKCSFVSNVYKLLVERKGDGLALWDSFGDSKKPAAAPKVSCGIVSQSVKETYFCAPPIMVKDTFAPLKARDTTQRFILIEPGFNGHTDKQRQQTTTTSVAGYTVYRAAVDSHDSHFNKTWVPSVTVDSTTFDCSFEVVYTSRRRQEECLECALKDRHDGFSPAVSSLLVNH